MTENDPKKYEFVCEMVDQIVYAGCLHEIIKYKEIAFYNNKTIY